MKDFRISGHVSNDDWRHYEFVRNTRLPWGTFGKSQWKQDALVLIVSVLCLLAAIIIVNICP